LTKLVGVICFCCIIWSLGDIIFSAIYLSDNTRTFLCSVRFASSVFCALYVSFTIAFFSCYYFYALFAQSTPNRSSLFFWVAILIIGLLSVLFVVLLFTVDNVNSDPTWCITLQDLEKFFWYFPAGLCYFSSLLVYICIVCRSYYLMYNSEKVRVPLRLSGYILAFLVLWSFRMVDLIYYRNASPSAPQWFSLTETVLFHLYGFVFLLVYIYNAQNVVREYNWYIGFLLWTFGCLSCIYVILRAFWLLINEKRMNYAVVEFVEDSYE